MNRICVKEMSTKLQYLCVVAYASMHGWQYFFRVVCVAIRSSNVQ